MTKPILMIIAALLIVGMIGCAPAAQAPKTDKVAYLIDSTLGDKAFYDSGQLGIDQLAKEYGIETRTIEARFESAYLAGVVAGLTTLDTTVPGINPDKTIGAVGGDVDPVVSAFVFAYTNGAQSIDPQITVETKYLGSWDDTAKGKQAALQLYNMNADIVFQIAGAAGLGVLQAAGERGLYAIGWTPTRVILSPDM